MDDDAILPDVIHNKELDGFERGRWRVTAFVWKHANFLSATSLGALFEGSNPREETRGPSPCFLEGFAATWREPEVLVGARLRANAAGPIRDLCAINDACAEISGINARTYSTRPRLSAAAEGRNTLRITGYATARGNGLSYS